MSTQNEYLAPNGTLAISDSLLSPDGRVRLVLTPASEINLFVDEIGIWSSNIIAGPNCYLVMQGNDGHLCLYRNTTPPGLVWCAQTVAGSGAYLRVLNSGIAGLFQVTTIQAQGLSLTQPWSGGLSVLWAGQGLAVGQSLKSPNAQHTLSLTSSGLVLDGHAVSSTTPKGTPFATMQTDGNFVLYDFSDNQEIWMSGTPGGNTTACHVGLADSGHLMVFKLVESYS